MPKIKKMTKIHKDGGPQYRLTTVQDSLNVDQTDLDNFELLRLGIATPYGLISSPYSLVNKKNSPQEHNVIKGVHKEFTSVFEYISYYAYTGKSILKLENYNSLKKELEVEIDLIPLKLDRFIGKAILIIIPKNQAASPEYNPITCVKDYISPPLITSLENHCNKDKKEFKKHIDELKKQMKRVKHERDIYILDNPLCKLGINLQHIRKGIDSPKSSITFCKDKSTKTIEMPIELKKTSSLLYADLNKQAAYKKYFNHFPFTVICMEHDAKKWKLKTGIGIIELKALIKHCGKLI